MRRINVIHFVESNQRHAWLEKLISALDDNGFSQALITIEPAGAIHEYLSTTFPNLSVNRVRKARQSIHGGIMEVAAATRNTDVNIMLSFGHLPSFITALGSITNRFIFVFCHMQQPRYFEFMESKWRGRIHNLAYRFYVHRANLIFSLSLEVRERLYKVGIENDKIASINIGINFKKIEGELNSPNTMLLRNKGNPNILMVGRIAPEKNYPVGIKAFAIFLKTHPQATLSIAGEGPQQLEIMALAKNLGIGDRINMLGYVNNIPKLMTNFDLLLHLASTESYGQIYIEALLSGLPVICSRTGVAIDLYESEEPGIILVTTQTPECINKELISFFDKTRLPKEEKVGLFEHLYTHEDSYVYQGIIDCLLKLGGEGKGGSN